MTSGFVAYPPSGRCSFIYSKGSIIGPAPNGSGEKVVDGYFTLACSGAGGGGFGFVAWDPGDYRNWQAGTLQLFTSGGRFGSDHCDLDGMELTVTVETATGGPAAYPKLVTDDFVRTFRLDFDTSGVTPTRNGGPCDFPVSAQVSLHLTQTTADYVYDPNAPCFYD